MAVENLKSASITNLDASPPVANTAGEGAPAFTYRNFDFITVDAAASVTSTYRILRVPSTAKLKSVNLESEAMGAGAFDISVYYSDSPWEGDAAKPSGVVPTTGSQFFAASFSCASAVAPTNIINNAGNNPMSNRNKPLWAALGLTSDPGGAFDLVAVVDTTAVTTGAARLGLYAEYTS